MKKQQNAFKTFAKEPIFIQSNSSTKDFFYANEQTLNQSIPSGMSSQYSKKQSNNS
jgi:hypothetical protein